jgi:hypothetical protein
VPSENRCCGLSRSRSGGRALPGQPGGLGVYSPPRIAESAIFPPDSRPGNRLLRLAVHGVGVRAHAEPSHRSASSLWVPLSPTAMQTRLAGQDTEFSCAVSPDGVALS